MKQFDIFCSILIIFNAQIPFSIHLSLESKFMNQSEEQVDYSSVLINCPWETTCEFTSFSPFLLDLLEKSENWVFFFFFWICTFQSSSHSLTYILNRKSSQTTYCHYFTLNPGLDWFLCFQNTLCTSLSVFFHMV